MHNCSLDGRPDVFLSCFLFLFLSGVLPDFASCLISPLLKPIHITYVCSMFKSLFKSCFQFWWTSAKKVLGLNLRFRFAFRLMQIEEKDARMCIEWRRWGTKTDRLVLYYIGVGAMCVKRGWCVCRTYHINRTNMLYLYAFVRNMI